jgi:hypothetical protein
MEKKPACINLELVLAYFSMLNKPIDPEETTSMAYKQYARLELTCMLYREIYGCDIRWWRDNAS